MGPNVNGSNTFVLRDDDKVEYAKLNHELRRHESSYPKTTCLVASEAGVFGIIIIAYTAIVLYIICYSKFPLIADDSLTLDSLLIQLRPQVTPIWYQFGVALGIPEEVLNNCVGYPDEECIVEVLDHWLRNHKGKPTWRDVARALKDVELYQLADSVLNIYKTGKWHGCIHCQFGVF